MMIYHRVNLARSIVTGLLCTYASKMIHPIEDRVGPLSARVCIDIDKA